MAMTEQQNKAVKINGQNVIVSAGAGSGKTRVLTERVFDRISNSEYKWNIDEMLVLTFTNAAAANMKVRIRNKLLLNEDNKLTTAEKNKQLNKLDNSYIMTFDAYAQFLVNKYHNVLNVDKNIKIIDSNVIKNKTYEILDNILKEEYENKNINFINLINNFCVKDDNQLRENIIFVNNKLNNIYQRNNFVSNYENTYFNNEKLNKYLNEYTKTLLSKINTINNLLNDLSFEVEDYKDYFVGIDVLLTCQTYSQIKNNLNIDTSKRMFGQSEEAKKIKKTINELLNELKNDCVFDEDQLIEQILNTKNDVMYILYLAEKLNNKLIEFKKQYNAYEFFDIFSMAIKLVDENDDIRNEIKNYFKEILIDEYQDTNDLQDEFIKKISNNNVYMVGDIKQSIYRFRNANPDIFKEKYTSYSDNDGGACINLNANFRSRREVLDSIDKIFARIMDISIGGANYELEHKMTAGNSDYEAQNKGKIDTQSNKTEVLSYEYDRFVYPSTDLDKSEVEAFIIAKDIKEKIGSHFKVTYLDKEIDENGHEKEATKVRDAEFKDFTILADRGTNFDTIKQILTSQNIPCDIQAEETMNESDLIITIRALFKLINCIKENDFGYDFKFSYMSLARSFLVEMLDTTLYDVITNNKIQETDLYKTVLEIVDNIETKTISNIIDEFIDKFDVYNKLIRIGDVNENLIKIDYLYQLADSLNELGYNYKTFNEYLVNIFDFGSEDTIKFKTHKENKNAVLITNIHQAKGLEYSICYYPYLNVSFNRKDLSDSFVFDKDNGLIIPTMIKDKGLKQTIIKEIYKQKYLIDDLSERLRLFYVALTRAKEKIIIVCPLENKTADGLIINDERRLSIRSYCDMLNLVYDDISEYIRELDFNDYANILNKDYKLLSNDIFKNIPKSSKKIELNKKITIKPSLIEDASYSKKSGLLTSDAIKNMELGSRVHYYLQIIDFNNPNYELIDKKYVEFIKSFLNSDIMANISEGKAYKEYEFIYKEENVKKHGFIDLLIEYDDHFDIIDYKTKNIDDEHYDEQLNGYRKYIEDLTNKTANCYLYSIVDKTYRTVNKHN